MTDTLTTVGTVAGVGGIILADSAALLSEGVVMVAGLSLLGVGIVAIAVSMVRDVRPTDPQRGEPA